jgi:N-acyl-D-amino-acid deacylase
LRNEYSVLGIGKDSGDDILLCLEVDDEDPFEREIMTILEKACGRSMPRRGFLRWLTQAASASAFFSVFGGGVSSRSRASAGQTEAAGVMVGESGKTPKIEASGRRRSRLLLKNGLIVDGTGEKAYQGDLLINGGKIETVGPGQIEVTGEAIDCTGKVVAPGFIDMHSHMDWVLPAKGHHELKSPFTSQGITTFVTGNCGYGIAAFKKNSRFRNILESKTGGLYPLAWDTMEEYFNSLERQGITHNLANLAGHGTTRASIHGFQAAPLNDDEMTELLYLLEEALDQGAYGVSFGLQYEPGIFSALPELKKVAQLVKRKDKIVTVHLRAYSSLSGTYPLRIFGTPHNLLAIEEMLNLARETGIKLQLSHLIFVGERTWDSYQNAFELIDEAIHEGVDVKFDTYAYHCGNSIINVFMPAWFLAEVPKAFESRSSLLRLRAEITLIEKLLGFGYGDIQITNANHPELARFNGMFLTDIAEERGMGQFENFVDFASQTNGKARVLNHRYSNLEQVKAMMQHPASLFQTDTEVARTGVQNPAAFGNFPRFLQYARDFRLLGLEEVIHKMTGAAAEQFSIKDTGLLQANFAADITVFDWKRVKDNNTTEKTSETPSGIEHVFINGQPALTNGRLNTSILPGRVL